MVSYMTTPTAPFRLAAYKVLNINRPLALGLLFLVNLAHPFLHAFEGGGLDVIIHQLDMLAMHVDPAVDHNHKCAEHDHGSI